jgi:hypothetical protein
MSKHRSTFFLLDFIITPAEIFFTYTHVCHFLDDAKFKKPSPKLGEADQKTLRPAAGLRYINSDLYYFYYIMITKIIQYSFLTV